MPSYTDKQRLLRAFGREYIYEEGARVKTRMEGILDFVRSLGDLTPDFDAVYVPPVVAEQTTATATGPTPERRAELLAERQKLQNTSMYGKNWGQQTQIRSRIRAINTELAGNADQKAVFNWIKARARKGLGAFDAEVMAAAFRFLPETWTLEEAVTPRAESDRGYAADTSDGFGRKKGWRYYYAKGFPTEEYVVVPADKNGRPIIPEGATPEDKKIYITEGPNVEESPDHRARPEDRLVFFRYPTILTHVYRVTAPNGETKDIAQKAENADGLYKWAYLLGLADQAQAALPKAEAAVPKAASTVSGWARNQCQICFETHSLAPTAKTIVDHGYFRPGTGQNEQACYGSRWAAYSESCHRTQWHLDGLIGALKSNERRLGELEAGCDVNGVLVFSVTVYKLDAKGKRIPVPEATQKQQRRMGWPVTEWEVKSEAVHQQDPRWEPLRRVYIGQRQAEIAKLKRMIPFYRAAVHLWPPKKDASADAVIQAIMAEAPNHQVIG